VVKNITYIIEKLVYKFFVGKQLLIRAEFYTHC